MNNEAATRNRTLMLKTPDPDVWMSGGIMRKNPGSETHIGDMLFALSDRNWSGIDNKDGHVVYSS
jgi:hypothetical protein